MRSSIACTKCRRSKVKCENDGIGTQCRACRQQGRICDYPTPGANATPGRRESVAASHTATSDRLNEDGPQKKRKRIAPTSSYSLKDNLGTYEDPLNPQLLTPQVWKELFEIFQQHFATDLSFLHATTFLKPLQQPTVYSPQNGVSGSYPSSLSRPPFGPHFLLAFLALTSPFHPSLVKYHSRDPSRPCNHQETAQYYAKEARALLSGDLPLEDPIETTQALLMLGLYEWNSSQGLKSWLTIRTAISLAQVAGLQHEPALDNVPDACTDDRRKPDFAPIQQEIRRRTFWSCFIMDRYISSGKNRARMLEKEHLRIQLPCSDRAFNFGQDVKTMMLGEEMSQFEERIKASGHSLSQGNTPSSGGIKYEYGNNEDILARFIRAIDLWGDVIRWSCAGARRYDRANPWDPKKSEFYHLEKRLNILRQDLPSELVLNPSMTDVHIISRTSRNYVLMHTALTLCTTALHREYLPYCPFKRDKPEGPLDEPIITDKPAEPTYWEDRARLMFKTTRDFNDLIGTCQQSGVLVETPLTGFATYHVVYNVLYCHYFPKMDQGRYLCKDFTQWDNAWGILLRMQERSRMAYDWCKTIKAQNDFFINAKKTYRTLAGSPGSSTGSSIDYKRTSISEGGYGLYEYATKFEKDVKQFGNLEDKKNIDIADADRVSVHLRQNLDDASESGSTAAEEAVKSEHGDSVEQTPESTAPSTGWQSVNTPAKSESEVQSVTNGQAYQYPQHTRAAHTNLPSANHEGYHTYASPSNHHPPHMAPSHAESMLRAPPNSIHQVNPMPIHGPLISASQWSQQDKEEGMGQIESTRKPQNDILYFGAPNSCEGMNSQNYEQQILPWEALDPLYPSVVYQGHIENNSH